MISIINLLDPYKIKKKETLKFIGMNLLRIKPRIKRIIDSYSCVGWTAIPLPISFLKNSLLKLTPKNESVFFPKQHPAKKQPNLPHACV